MKVRTLSLTVVYLLLAGFAVLMLVPFAYLVCGALKGKADFLAYAFLPGGDGWLGVAWERLNFDNFRRLFTEIGLVRPLVNSIFIASTTSLAATLFGAMGGYALSKFSFPGRRPLTLLVLSAMVIPGPLLLAPGFKVIHELGLLDQFAGLLLPAMTPAFGVFLFRQAMLNTVPDELLEAARMDGAGEVRIFFAIVLPLVRPMIGAHLMIAFLGMWNNFIQPQIVLQQTERQPLSVAINGLKGLYATDYGLIMAGTLVSIAPVMCLFLLLQREFINGLTSGAVKG